MNFQLSTELDDNKVFLVKRSDLNGRFDPYFYKPSFVKIDNEIRTKTKTKLGDLIISMYGGATPKKSEQKKYYADKENGVPFLRVQNITEEGINIDDAIYINYVTHEGYLRRSAVFQDDLLVTITGRIASSAVAPVGFVGNINQHSVVIKTKNRKASKYLAAFLNSDIGQKLALKRTTGGTRPALDYEALKSIPILENLPIVEKMDTAYTAKKQKENEALVLLKRIDDYLLGELGIELPERKENTIHNRIFKRQFSNVSGGRFDAFFNLLTKQAKSGKYPFFKLKDLVHIRKGDSITGSNVCEGDIPVIAGGQTSPYKHNIANNNGDIITVSSSGHAGYVWYHRDPVFASDCTMISSLDINRLNNVFLFEYLKAEQDNIYLLQQGSVQPHVYPSDLEKIKIPLPPIEKQLGIVEHITDIRRRAKQLQQQGKVELEQAKKEVEAMILGTDKQPQT